MPSGLKGETIRTCIQAKMPKIPPKLIYIFGFPYSGSTIFSIALGSSSDIFNAGEISFIENDYHDANRCSCGKTLAECKFWARISRSLLPEKVNSLDLSETGRLRDIDARDLGIIKKLMLLSGFSIERVFSPGEVIDYARRHEEFLSRLHEVSGATYILDSSKSERRLTSLLRYTDIDIKIILLKRPAVDIYAARLKRARRRNPLYHSLLSPLYLAWLVYGLKRIERCLDEVPAHKVAKIDLDRFTRSPHEVLQNLNGFLGDSFRWRIDDHSILDFRKQHVFTGNAWLRKIDDSHLPVVIQRPRGETISPLERYIFKLGTSMFPRIGVWDGSSS